MAAEGSGCAKDVPLHRAALVALKAASIWGDHSTVNIYAQHGNYTVDSIAGHRHAENYCRHWHFGIRQFSPIPDQKMPNCIGLVGTVPD
jgi:hypothetical protein